MKWHICESLYFEKLSGNVFALIDRGDETCIGLLVEDIDDTIKALQSIKSHYKSLELDKQEKEKLAIWGKRKTPTEY
jgi:hypothetical protein